ncbi:hypothetical protein [Streptomyces sp. 6N223]|uniref:hypothetical protein n=1 Tax=Streptomyces sp. 6N223 TaxID=3457412 RepID=UPI003FCF113E
MLTGIVDRAARSDGIELYLSTHSVLGVPVPASLLVSAEPEDPRLPDAIPVELLADGLREKHGERAEVAVVALPSGPAVRCRRRELTDDARDLGVPPDRSSTPLEIYVPVPGSRAWLLLTFSAPLPELAEAQVEMFDVIAASLRWSWEG